MNQTGLDSLGYTQVTDLTAAVGVGVIPAGTESVMLQAEAQNVRMRDDGIDPEAGVGMLLVTNTIYTFTVARLARMKFIEAAASAKLNITFYGRKV